MKKILTLSIFCVFSLNAFSQEKNENQYKKLVISAWKLSSRISPDPIKLNYVFDKSFFNLVSKEKTIEILKKLYDENGSVINVTSITYHNDKNGDFFFHTDKNNIIPVSITINDKGKITSVFFRPSFQKTTSLEDLTKKFENLKYEKKGLLIKRLGNIEDIVYSLNENEIFAIASSFKLYILLYLIENDVKMDKILKLDENLKSLPSGKLHLYPDNSPFTILTLASLMISESDNTAADMLIDFIKRERLEKFIASYNSSPELNIPFLKTQEKFKLNSSTQSTQNYINSNLKEKRKILKSLEKEKLNIYKIDFSKPNSIDSIEWFASPQDMCRVMEYFRNKNNSIVNSILSINPGLDTKTKNFIYAGYKGGSEAGVISTNWLLKTKNGKEYCISAVVNDTQKLINEKEFLSMMQDIINFLGD